MYTDILSELTTALGKLYTLEESIVYADRLEHQDLRSKQALLISEVIQSLQDMENSIKRESISLRQNTSLRCSTLKIWRDQRQAEMVRLSSIRCDAFI